MATFKRLTKAGEEGEKGEKGDEIDVNMDTVTHMQRFTDHTRLWFALPYDGSLLSLVVKETPDQIHQETERG